MRRWTWSSCRRALTSALAYAVHEKLVSHGIKLATTAITPATAPQPDRVRA